MASLTQNGESHMKRVLYSGNRNASSWAFRAWLALKEQDIAFKEIIVDIRRPQRWKNLAEIAHFSPPAAVPVLDDNGFIIFDSSAIMEYASELGTTPLLPSDIKARARARALVAWHILHLAAYALVYFLKALFILKRNHYQLMKYSRSSKFIIHGKTQYQNLMETT